MSNQNNGGSAFPCLPPQDTAAGVATGYPFPETGMTLRDYFAAKVLPQCRENCSTNQRAAEEAYIVADAMLKARQQ